MAWWRLCETFFSSTSTNQQRLIAKKPVLKEPRLKTVINDGPFFNKILCFNVQSLNNKVNELDVLLDEGGYMALCVNEHWLNHNNCMLPKFTNYDVAAMYCRSDMKGGGVAIYLRSGIDYKHLNVDQFCSVKNIELAAIILSQLNIILVSIYRSTSGDIDIFLNNLDKLLIFLNLLKLQILISGDFNIDITDGSVTSIRFLNVLRAANCYCCNKDPTRGKACLDNAVSNIPRSEIFTTVLPVHFSDHEALEVFISRKNSEVDAPELINIGRRCINDDNLFNFRMFLNSCD